MIKISDIYKLENSREYVNDVITSEWLTFSGIYIKKCEKMLEELLGIKHVLLTNNGSAATHCLIKSIKLEYPECKKIYVQNNCYIAAYNSVLTEFKNTEIEILPIDENTWNLDLKYLNKIEKNSALLIVHNLGNILPINKIKNLRPDIIIVEDNCEGFMGSYNKKYSGTEALASSVSFFANKHITSGEGGAFMTNNTKLYKKIISFTRQGISEYKYIHIMHAYNYKMSNINAAILYSQLEQLDIILKKKTILFNRYYELLENEKNIELQKIEENTCHSKWIFGIKILKNLEYKDIELFFNNNNIEIRPFFYDIYKHKYLNNIKKTVSKSLNHTIILLPLHANLNISDIDYISNIIKKFISKEIN